MKRIRLAFALAALALVFPACARRERGITVLWTDQVEFASYAELFNASQGRYRIAVEYKENPAEALIGAPARDRPDIVVGPWLKGERTRSKLIPVDYLFNELKINPKHFYQPLLDLGNVHGRQYLLPVSFNLPALVFSSERRDLVTDDYALSLDQLKELARAYNTTQRGVYTRMGFSPRWDPEFLYIVARLFNSRFEEGNPLLSWHRASLAESVDYLRAWTRDINTSPQAEDDFQFKFLYDPPYKLVTGGRNLFSYMPSDALFVLPADKIQNIDFRWVSRNGSIPIQDDIIYMGICKKARHLEAAEAFFAWFFSEETQRALLERGKTMGTMRRSFGISDGFSSLRPVNERAFPLYYPALLGHLPPAESLGVPRILPNSWKTLKREIVLPYLVEAVKVDESAREALPDLGARLVEWRKTN